MKEEKTSAQKGRAARTKGQRGEREVCEILTRITGTPHKRNLGQARDSGGDVNFGIYLLEVKHVERLKLPEWMEQAAAAAHAAELLPAVVYRQNGQKFWVATPFEEFVEVFHALKSENDRLKAETERGRGPA